MINEKLELTKEDAIDLDKARRKYEIDNPYWHILVDQANQEIRSTIEDGIYNSVFFSGWTHWSLNCNPSIPHDQSRKASEYLLSKGFNVQPCYTSEISWTGYLWWKKRTEKKICTGTLISWG